MAFDEIEKEEIKLRAGVSSPDAVPLALQSTDSAGSVLKAGRYVLKEEVSRGTAGILHKAVDPKTGASLIVRILKTPAGASVPFKKRLKLEVEALSRLSHPSILQTIEFGEMDDGLPYLATEYVADPTLFDVLHARADLDKSTLVGYLIGVCEALAHAHQNNVVHRKLTTDKIFISEMTASHDDVRVGGFGTGWIGDSRKADPRADVLAFGKIIEEMFAGRAIPAELQNVIDFCISEHAAERYSDCRELLGNLLLINQGKLPLPPVNRPGQALMKPKVVAAIIAITIAVTAFICFRPQTTQKSASTPSVPAAVRQPLAEDGEKEASGRASTNAARSTYNSAQTTGNDAQSKPDSSQVESYSPAQSRLTKSAVKSTAVKGAVNAARAYQGLSPEEKRQAQKSALKGATKAVQKWQTMNPQTKQTVKEKAATFGGKAARFWKGLPDR